MEGLYTFRGSKNKKSSSHWRNFADLKVLPKLYSIEWLTDLTPVKSSLTETSLPIKSMCAVFRKQEHERASPCIHAKAPQSTSTADLPKKSMTE